MLSHESQLFDYVNITQIQAKLTELQNLMSALEFLQNIQISIRKRVVEAVELSFLQADFGLRVKKPVGRVTVVTLKKWKLKY